jgi:hypothetical protein
MGKLIISTHITVGTHISALSTDTTLRHPLIKLCIRRDNISALYNSCCRASGKCQ